MKEICTDLHETNTRIACVAEDLNRVRYLLNYLVTSGMLSHDLQWHEDNKFWDIRALHEQTVAFARLASDKVDETCDELEDALAELDAIWLKSKDL